MKDVFINKYHFTKYYFFLHKRLIVLSIILFGVIILYLQQKYDFLRLRNQKEININIMAYPRKSSFTPQEKTKYHLFYIEKSTGNIVMRDKMLPEYTNITEKVKTVITKLITNSPSDCVSGIPQKAELENIFVSPKGYLYLNFNKAFSTFNPGGTSAEETTISILTKTIKNNFYPEIKCIYILIAGKKKKTLKGHVDISHPFWFLPESEENKNSLEKE